MAAKKLKEWFDHDCAMRIGAAIKPNMLDFDCDAYANEVAAGIEALELKDRVFLFASVLRNHLPESYASLAKILSRSLGPELEGETGMFTQGYWLMPIARFVEEFGLVEFNISMNLCAAITTRHTSEYAVRPYIEQNMVEALKYAKQWTQSDSSHLRRLASEGVRPRLPWARKLSIFIDDPDPALEIATLLKSDASPYVKKSVANLLNDVSKDHPETIEKLAKKWKVENNKHTDWIVHHGTRTLRKRTSEKKL